MSTEWYVKSGNKVHGPMSSKRLKSIARSGKLTSTMSVRKNQDGVWVVAGDVPGLMDSSQNTTSERSFDSDSMASQLYSELPLFRKADVGSATIATCLFAELSFYGCREFVGASGNPLFVVLLVCLFLLMAASHGAMILLCISLMTGDVYYKRLINPKVPVLDKWSIANKVLAPVFGLFFLLSAFQSGYQLFRLLFVR
jgi:hypothetical protein